VSGENASPSDQAAVSGRSPMTSFTDARWTTVEFVISATSPFPVHDGKKQRRTHGARRFHRVIGKMLAERLENTVGAEIEFEPSY